MTVDLKSYPTMRDSGVLWLGAVPSHWQVCRVGRLLREVDVRSRTGTETHLSMSQRLGLVPSAEVEERRLFSESYVGAKLCWLDDLVLNRLKAHLGVFARASQAGLVSPDYTVLRAVSPDGTIAFLEYVLKSLPCRTELRTRAKGVVEGFWRLYTDDFYQIKLPVPPISEQAAIVHFLDQADGRIRRYIRAKQRLVKLLEEQKQATIHSALTGGLDPNVRLKPSGIEWLRDLPEHWKIVRLGRVIELSTGFPFKSDGFTQHSEDVRLLRGVNVSPGRIRWTDVVRWPQSDRDNYSAFELRAGDIVLGMDRPIIQTGTRITIVSESDVPALLLQRVARIRPIDELSGEFLALLLAGKSFADYLTPIFTGISVPHLSPEQIKSFRFALPPNNEQRQIVQWATEKTKNATAAVLSAEREIDLLREYRTRLIAEVVTGAMDVREALAQLPKDIVEPDAGDEVDTEGDVEQSADEIDALATEAEA